MSIKVVKFGGSSLADADHFRQVAAIVKADPHRRYVVPSAPGKRDKGDTKVTDLLYRCYDLIKSRSSMESIDACYNEIRARYTSIIADLGLDYDISGELDYVRNAMLGFDFIDAENVIFFKDNGTLDEEKTNAELSAELEKHKYAVIPGFYGGTPNGTVKTFSRGGSDITGSIVAKAAKADLYENWTDVSGFMMADPRIIDNPCIIKEITYRELRELSYMGATVLHEDAVFPVRSAGIPINIRNPNRPEDEGTMIVSHSLGYDSEHIITGIAGKKGFSVLTIEKDSMNTEVGFGRKVLEVFEDNEISFEHLPSGIDTMSVVVPTTALEGRREKLMNAIVRAVRPDSVFIEDELTLIAVVGRGMVKAKGTSARVCDALARADINIRIIDQGSSELNIIVGVDDDAYEDALKAIYAEFVKA